MMCHCTYQPVMFCHDAESFFERSLPVLGGHTFVKIVDDCQVRIVQCAGFLHDADAPVEVGGITELQVVWLHQRMAGEECLVADPHSLFEAFPG